MDSSGQKAEEASCVVVVPVYKSELSEDELISVRHLYYYLNGYRIVLAIPSGLNVSSLQFDTVEFDDAYFQSRQGYSQLLLSREFYSSFERYDFILIYQLDCLVFSGDLNMWLNAGYDYIGAPWFSGSERPEKGFSRTGNGGLSLRKTSAFLKVIDSKKYISEQPSFLGEYISANLPDLSETSVIQRFKKKASILRDIQRGSESYRKSYTLNEDHFWSDRAKLFYPDFRIAPPDISFKFAFEKHPEYCYRLNNNTLPFGCHAWTKWGREFWRQFVINE